MWEMKQSFKDCYIEVPFKASLTVYSLGILTNTFD
jgi:hypothetical protein